MHNVENYTIGKGKGIFKESGETNFRDLGNIPDLKFKVTWEELQEHFSSRSGFKTKDKEGGGKRVGKGSFTVDELMDENVKMAILASAIVDVVQASGTTVDEVIVAELERWLSLGKKKLSSVVIKAETPPDWEATTAYTLGEFVGKVTPNAYRYECTTAGTSAGSEPTWPTTIGATVTDGTVVWTCRKLTYAVDVDYVLDVEVGLFMPLSTGAIAADQNLLYSSSHAAITTKKMSAATAATIEGDFWFVGDPPIGQILDVKGYIFIKPAGDMIPITETWMNITFDFEFIAGHGYGDGLFDIEKRGVVV